MKEKFGFSELKFYSLSILLLLKTFSTFMRISLMFKAMSSLSAFKYSFPFLVDDVMYPLIVAATFPETHLKCTYLPEEKNIHSKFVNYYSTK